MTSGIAAISILSNTRSLSRSLSVENRCLYGRALYLDSSKTIVTRLS